jgi:hypothetical protein
MAEPVATGVLVSLVEADAGDVGASSGELGDEKANTCRPAIVNTLARSTATNARNARPTADLAFSGVTPDPSSLVTTW